jgi:competence protein ComFA
MSEFLGRQVVVEVNQKLPSTVTCREALVLGDKVFCQRCGSHFVKEIAELPNGDIYCPFCIAFGRLTSRHLLASEEEQTEARDIQFTWSGTLTNFQQKISDVLIKNYQKNKHSLIWAVAEYS